MNILIANEGRLIGEGIGSIIKSSFNQANIVVINSGNNLVEKVITSASNAWNVILVDPKLSKLAPPKWLHKHSPNTKVCLISTQDNSNIKIELLKQGFNGLLSTSSTASEVEYLMGMMLSGKNYFPENTNLPIRRFAKNIENNSKSNSITYRQREILSLVALGLSNKEVANHYGLAESTVKRHLSNIFSKLGVQNRVEAIRSGAASELLLNG